MVMTAAFSSDPKLKSLSHSAARYGNACIAGCYHPYPKSRAKDLHPDEIEIESESETRVGFVPFMGISPLRYRDIFQKGRRKRVDGKSADWFRGEPAPMIDFVLPNIHVQ
jgi:hypothetical protein